jgi:hypothetical protein
MIDLTMVCSASKNSPTGFGLIIYAPGLKCMGGGEKIAKSTLN